MISFISVLSKTVQTVSVLCICTLNMNLDLYGLIHSTLKFMTLTEIGPPILPQNLDGGYEVLLTKHNTLTFYSEYLSLHILHLQRKEM